jgi:hypothetical protein
MNIGSKENMNTKLIRVLKISGIFVLGVIVGAILMNLLHMYVRPVFLRIIQTEYEVEQELLAARATRNNDNLRAVLHRWNLVESESSSLQVFRKNKCQNDTAASFLFPFYLIPLNMMTMTQEQSLEKGGKIVESLNRGKLAIALESIGQTSEAKKQWEAAKSITPGKSIEQLREQTLRLMTLENSDLQIEVEKAILDRTKAQQQN